MSMDFFAALAPGARVVVRHRLAPAELGPAGEQLTDALGYLRASTDSWVEIETRSGLVRIDRASITHAKVVPPAPERRRRAARP